MLSRRAIVVGTAILIGATLAAYVPAIRSGYIWDDDQHISNNVTLRSFEGLSAMWLDPTSLPQWYPLTHTTFWIEYHLWGTQPLGYHIDNILLHIASALLIWRLLVGLSVPGAWLAAAIFALHPIEVESVAWVTERKNVLSGMLCLLSLITYLKWTKVIPILYKNSDFSDPGTERGRWQNYALSLILFLAALLSKSVIATMPAVVLVIIWWKRGRIRWSDVTPLIPFFIIGAAMGWYTAHLEVVHVGADGQRIVELQLSALQRLLIAGRAICFYAGKLVYPWPLVFIYPQWKKIDPGIWWQWIFPIAVAIAIVALLLNRKRLGRGPAAGVMIFCGVLFPALGFLNVYPMRFSYVADHFQYHAGIALIAMIAAVLCRYAKQYGRLVLVPLLALTLLQTTEYKDAETLWRATLARNGDSWMVLTNLGTVLAQRGLANQDDKAMTEADDLFYRALLADSTLHDTHADYGMVLARRGQNDRAMAEFTEALKINPTFAPAYFGMGQVYEHENRPQEAAESYQKAIDIAPKYSYANYRLGRLLEQQGNLPEAADHYRTALILSPDDSDMRYDLGTVLIRLHEYPEAVYNLLQATRLKPDWPQAWANLGAAQLGARHPEDAIPSFQQALRLKPDLQPAQMGLKQASALMGLRG